MFCKQCGAQIDDKSLFCQVCGCKCESLNANVQEQSNAPSIPKKDRLTNISLILSVFSIFLPLGIILPLPGIPVPEGLVILFCVFGFLAFLPAFIISSIAFIRVLIKLIKSPKNEKRVKGFKRRSIAFCVAMIFPILLIFFRTPIKYKNALVSYENHNYSAAAEIFKDIDYKNSQELADECYYLEGVNLAKNFDYSEALSALSKVSQENYRATDQLKFYCHVAHSAINKAENTLYSNLKNPSSYSCYSIVYQSASLSDSTTDQFYIDVAVSIQYSATNSFGATLMDTYSYKGTIPIVNTYKFTNNDVTTILNKSVAQIIEEYDK